MQSSRYGLTSAEQREIIISLYVLATRLLTVAGNKTVLGQGISLAGEPSLMITMT